MNLGDNLGKKKSTKNHTNEMEKIKTKTTIKR